MAGGARGMPDEVGGVQVLLESLSCKDLRLAQRLAEFPVSGGSL